MVVCYTLERWLLDVVKESVLVAAKLGPESFVVVDSSVDPHEVIVVSVCSRAQHELRMMDLFNLHRNIWVVSHLFDFVIFLSGLVH